MSTSLVTLILIVLLSGPQPPNYYESLLSAKAASKKSQKEMVVFFGNKSCNECDQAWGAFAKDLNATDRYISTRMNADDFDGGIFFDLLDLEGVPSWIILSPDGKEIERWEGGWKDANGNPFAFDMSVQPKVSKDEKTDPPTKTASTTIAKPSPNLVKTTTVSIENKTFIDAGYKVQTGYFGSASNAQKIIDDLKSKGFSGYQSISEQKDGATFYRILSNSFKTESDALAEQSQLLSAGIKGSVKKM